MSQKDNEKAIIAMDGISSTSLENLKALQADAVIFGEVYDDIESGEIKITATIQAFNGKNIASESVRLSRGKRFDAASRELSMQELAEKLCSFFTPTPVPTSPPVPVCRLEDFESARKMKWWSPNPHDFSYGETTEQAYSGTRSFKVTYNKTFTYQFIGAELPPNLCDFMEAHTLQVWVYGNVALLLKLEDWQLRQVDISVPQAIDPNGWNLVSFNYAQVKDKIDLSNIKSIFFFPAPVDSSASGEFFLDDIVLLP